MHYQAHALCAWKGFFSEGMMLQACQEPFARKQRDMISNSAVLTRTGRFHINVTQSNLDCREV